MAKLRRARATWRHNLGTYLACDYSWWPPVSVRAARAIHRHAPAKGGELFAAVELWTGARSLRAWSLAAVSIDGPGRCVAACVLVSHARPRSSTPAPSVRVCTHHRTHLPHGRLAALLLCAARCGPRMASVARPARDHAFVQTPSARSVRLIDSWPSRLGPLRARARACESALCPCCRDAHDAARRDLCATELRADGLVRGPAQTAAHHERLRQSLARTAGIPRGVAEPLGRRNCHKSPRWHPFRSTVGER